MLFDIREVYIHYVPTIMRSYDFYVANTLEELRALVEEESDEDLVALEDTRDGRIVTEEGNEYKFAYRVVYWDVNVKNVFTEWDDRVLGAVCVCADTFDVLWKRAHMAHSHPVHVTKSDDPERPFKGGDGCEYAICYVQMYAPSEEFGVYAIDDDLKVLRLLSIEDEDSERLISPIFARQETAEEWLNERLKFKREIIHYTKVGTIWEYNGKEWRCTAQPTWEVSRRYALRITATYRELARWLAKGFGELSYRGNVSIKFAYNEVEADMVCEPTMLIRRWDESEWHSASIDYIMEDLQR